MTKKMQTTVSSRPPVVAVLGHVDHGKTTLLDYIRSSAVATREHGGITQHIGAYQVKVKTKEGQRLITFIDTPGHEAFAKMRSRGASAADIALLVVAADDSVKPQTKESIDQIEASGIPMIVVVNKIDLPSANPERVKQDLAKVGVQVEGWGGKVPVALVSAKTGAGIKELLDLILLLAQVSEHKNQDDAPLTAVVIETRLDKGKGMVATLIVKKGTLRVGIPLFEAAAPVAKVRAIFDEYGKPVAAADTSTPVEVLGFHRLPAVGALLRLEAVAAIPSSPGLTAVPESSPLPNWLKPKEEQEGPKLAIVFKADTAGSLEAVSASLPEKIRIVGSGVGDISEADILLAKSTGAFVVGFNVKCPVAVAKLAEAEKIIFRSYRLIYELLEELTEVVAGMKEVVASERELGTGTIIAEFPYEKQRIAGTQVVSGRLARGDSVKIVRKEDEITRAKIKSLRMGKEDVTKAEQGSQCGILFDRKVDFALQDAIIAVSR